MAKTKKARANLSGGVRAGTGGWWSCYRSGGEEKQAEAGSQGENALRATDGWSFCVSPHTLVPFPEP